MRHRPVGDDFWRLLPSFRSHGTIRNRSPFCSMYCLRRLDSFRYKAPSLTIAARMYRARWPSLSKRLSSAGGTILSRQTPSSLNVNLTRECLLPRKHRHVRRPQRVEIAATEPATRGRLHRRYPLAVRWSRSGAGSGPYGQRQGSFRGDFFSEGSHLRRGLLADSVKTRDLSVPPA